MPKSEPTGPAELDALNDQLDANTIATEPTDPPAPPSVAVGDVVLYQPDYSLTADVPAPPMAAIVVGIVQNPTLQPFVNLTIFDPRGGITFRKHVAFGPNPGQWQPRP